jgi:hypothetical protein
MYPNVPQHYDVTVTFDTGDSSRFRATQRPSIDEWGQWGFSDPDGNFYIYRADCVRSIVARAVVMPALNPQANQ